LLIDRATNLPASWSLLITTGTLALLAAGPLAWVNRMVLSNSVLRFYGAISFPLYLWHWPLLCFPAVLGIPMSQELRVIILTASVVLASLTHELVDRRAQKGAHQRGLPLAALAWLAALALCGWYVVSTDGSMASFPQDMQRAPF
jgi:peptidoglycan/LPS O-acetylase OafA/YrhL